MVICKKIIIWLTEHLSQTILLFSVHFIWSEISLKPYIYSSHSMKVNPLGAEFICKKHHNLKGFFQFEIIINVLVSSSCFIWIPMLWVHGQ